MDNLNEHSDVDFFPFDLGVPGVDAIDTQKGCLSPGWREQCTDIRRG